MKEQNFKNHGKLVPGFHGLTFLAILSLLIGSLINLANSAKENLYSASLISLIAFIFCLMFWFVRSFALRAQDRAIRAEENLRYFVLTGKLFPENLKMGQIIALRFAQNDEFLILVNKAVNENLSNKEIKMAIQQWRGDHHRV